MNNKEYEGNFYKVFLFLFYDDDYSNLPINAKLMYVLLSDKNDLSKQTAEQGNTQFFDEHNRLYSIYSNKDLATDLKVNINSVPRLKKQLKEKGLLFEEQQGLGLSNRIYPKQPYTDGFIYKYDISKWFLLPKDLFAYKYYNELDNQTKIFYSILYNTFRYSEKKGQYKNNGKVFCTLTYSKIEAITGFSREKIRKMKEDLRKKHLITYENGGFSKADRFYIHLPQISKNMEISDSKTWNHLRKESIIIKSKSSQFILDINNKLKINGYKLRHIKELTQTKHWNSHKRNIGTHTNETLELTQTKSNKTYCINPYGIKTHFIYTTTEKESSCSNISKYKNHFQEIENVYNIKLTKSDEQIYSNLFKNLTPEVINYGINYCSKGDKPKQYLKTILKNWIKDDVNTLEQAILQEYKYNKPIYKKSNVTKEMTPKWLLERDSEAPKRDNQEDMIDPEHEKKRIAFLEHLKERWGE